MGTSEGSPVASPAIAFSHHVTVTIRAAPAGIQPRCPRGCPPLLGLCSMVTTGRALWGVQPFRSFGLVRGILYPTTSENAAAKPLESTEPRTPAQHRLSQEVPPGVGTEGRAMGSPPTASSWVQSSPSWLLQSQWAGVCVCDFACHCPCVSPRVFVCVHVRVFVC